MSEEILFIDKSGDKKYYTQLPSIILNHSTANDQALYWQIKKHAGENGKCYATAETLRKKLGIGHQAYTKALNYLLEKEWIKFEGLTGGKTRPIKTYSIVDIWKMNILEYEKISSEMKVSFKKKIDKFQNGTKISSEMKVKEEPSKEEPNTLSKDKVRVHTNSGMQSFDYKEKLDGLLNNKQRRFQIIGLYWEYKDLNYENEDQYHSALKRELRSVKNLEGYSNEKILEVMDYLKQQDFKWTLETIHKYIDEPIRKKPFFRGFPMIERFGKWFVQEKGELLEFAGEKKQIIWK